MLEFSLNEFLGFGAKKGLNLLRTLQKTNEGLRKSNGGVLFPCLHHFLKHLPSRHGFLRPNIYFDDGKQVVHLPHRHPKVQRNANMAFQHRFHAAEAGQGGDGRHFPFLVAEHVPSENIGEEVLFQEHINFRAESAIAGLGRRDERLPGEGFERFFALLVFAQIIGDGRGGTRFRYRDVFGSSRFYTNW